MASPAPGFVASSMDLREVSVDFVDLFGVGAVDLELGGALESLVGEWALVVSG